MPARNRVKIYVSNAYYHVYNRGVDKRLIFQDDEDYRVFLSFLKFYLSEQPSVISHPVALVTGSDPVRIRPLKSFFNEIRLIAFCLMPNHFHLLFWQEKNDSMCKFMQALCTSYSMYFNHKYKRLGHLFQGTYKGVYIENDTYLLHLSRYIHLNPSELTGSDPVNLSGYRYSSYPYFLKLKRANWINPGSILNFFKSAQRITIPDIFSYQSFVEDYKGSHDQIANLTID